MSLLVAKNLSKTFHVYKRKGFFKREHSEVPALTDFSLTIDEPTIYGLVGPNGAGKTTFIKHCLGLVEKTSGEIEVLGYYPYKRKPDFLRQVGLVSGQKQNLDPNLSAKDSLMLSGYLYDMTTPEIHQRMNYLVEIFGVSNKIEVPVRQLSLGQRMKFEIISSVLHSPKFLFMDEPTIGLDFDSQSTMHELLLRLHKEQRLTILLTSHYLPDITTLCSQVAVIEDGKKVYDGTLPHLMKQANEEGYLKSLVKELSKVEKVN